MNNIWITVKKELRTIVRDKKSLIMMLITPMLIPLFMIMFSFVYDSMSKDSQTKTFSIGINYELSAVEEEIVSDLKLDIKECDSITELNSAYENDDISAYIFKENNKYTLYSNSNESSSAETAFLATQYLEKYNSYLGYNYLSQYDIDLNSVYSNLLIEKEELSGDNELANMILFMGVIFSMMAIVLTAIYGVCDTIAGEKERGTLETILTFPVKSSQLIIGKFLAISISCIITSIISEILIVISMSVCSNMFDIFKGVSLNLGFSTIICTFILMISYSFFMTGLCIFVASFSKNYKEAQSSLTPISFITMVPMFFYILKISIDFKISFIPVVGHLMIVNEIITLGINNSNYLYFIITLVSSVVYSLVLIHLIVKLYRNEKVLFSI